MTGTVPRASWRIACHARTVVLVCVVVLATAMYVRGVRLSVLRDEAAGVGAEAGGGAVLAASFLAYVVVGAYLAQRQPRNRVGPALLGLGSATVTYSFSTEHALHGLVEHPGSLPFTGLADSVRGSVALVAMTWLTALVLAAGASLILRYRSAGGLERQQLRWLALSVAFGARDRAGPASEPGAAGVWRLAPDVAP